MITLSLYVSLMFSAYIEQSWSDSLITKREKEWRLEDLEENADDLFYPTKARELEIRLGFYNYKLRSTYN